MSAQQTIGAAAYAAAMAEGFESALRAFIDGVPSHRALVSYALHSGHRTRPVGCLLACGAVGGDWSDALTVAVGIELLHKSSVIRDDIVDGDTMRSGQQAFHVEHGIPAAVAVSDLLWTTGLTRVAAGAATEVADRCLRATATVLQEMAAGQAEDVMPSPTRTGTYERLEVDELKTGSLAGLACGLGARVGGGTELQVAALTNYGRKIGTAFQVINDVRNLTGEEPTRFTASDLRMRRDTVLSAFAREAGAARDSRGGGELTDVEVEQTRDRLLESGAVTFGDELATRLLVEARLHLRALPPTPALEHLDSLTTGVLRDHAF
jgi:geranylgeranyl diphosphate synthase type I